MNSKTSDRFFSKRVSFIYITKNREKLFNEKLLELKNIKDQNDEIIVVNGGETDINDSDIDVYIKEPDISPGHGFNKGVMISKGRYLRPITDDDIVRKKQFNEAINIMDTNKDIDLLICGGVVKQDGKEYPYYFPPNTNYGKNIHDIIKLGVCGAGFIIRHSSIPLIGLHPIGILSDVEYVVQAIYNGGNIKFCRINLFYHPKHSDSLTIKFKDEAIKDLKKISTKYNINTNTNILTSYNSIPRKLIRYIVKNLFPNFDNKRIGKQDTFNINSQSPDFEIWDSKFS